MSKGVISTHKSKKVQDTKQVNIIHILKNRQYTRQKFEDTKGVNRSRKSRERQHNGQQLKATKGIIKIHKWKKNCQHNKLTIEDKSTNNDLKPLHRKIRKVFEDVKGGNQYPSIEEGQTIQWPG